MSIKFYCAGHDTWHETKNINDIHQISITDMDRTINLHLCEEKFTTIKLALNLELAKGKPK